MGQIMLRYTVAASAWVAVISPVAASAMEVPVGCAAPSASSSHRTYYVDPVRGNKNNDGSAAKPWRTLAEVVASKLVASASYSSKYPAGDRVLSQVNVNSPIKPGDTIVLMSGDHGTPKLQGYINTKFITVMAGQGQAPTVSAMTINGSSRWIFNGIKFQGRNTSTAPVNALLDIGRSNWAGATDNIIFTNNTVSTEDDVSGWSEDDWIKKPFYYGIFTQGTCITISNNRFYNLRNAMSISGDHSLVEGNVIENFGNDGIDIMASELTIRRNTIRGARHSATETLHSDGIQGWNIYGKMNRNVVIDSNFVINVGDAKVNTMQGIAIFDGKWDGLIVQNNVVATNHWHGISLYGVVNAIVANNTVVSSDPTKFPSWIMVREAKDKTPSQNVVIRNNITTSLIYSGINVSADHNIASNSITSTSQKVDKLGVYASSNRVDRDIYGTLMKVDNEKGIYDLRLKAGSPAIKAGNPDKAPTADIAGKARIAPVDIGAYAR